MPKDEESGLTKLAAYGLAAFAGFQFLKSSPKALETLIRGSSRVITAAESSYGALSRNLRGILKADGEAAKALRLSIFEDAREASKFIEFAPHGSQQRQYLQETLRSRYGASRNVGTLKQASVGDLFDLIDDLPLVGTEKQYYEIGRDRLRAEDVGNLRKIIDEGLLSRESILDKSFFIDPRAPKEIMDVRRLDPRNFVSNVVNLGRKVSYFGASPFDFLLPFAESERPIVAQVQRAVGSKAFGEYKEVAKVPVAGKTTRGGKTFVVGKKVFNVDEAGILDEGRDVKKLNLYRAVNPLSEYHIRNVGAADVPPSAEEILNHIPDYFKTEAQRAIYEGDAVQALRLSKKVGGFGGKLLEHYASTGGIFGERGFLGLQYAAKKPFVSDIYGFLKRQYEKDKVFDGAWDSVKNFAKDLFEFSEKPHRGFDLQSRIAAGESVFGAVRHLGRLRGGAGYTAMTSSEVALATVHKILETPFRILEATTGIGVKPGTLGQTIGRIGAFAGTAYMGWEAVKYADFLAEDTTGVSPIKAGLGGYTTLMTSQQRLLNLSGISSGAQIIEQGTGINLDSPLAKAVRFAALAIALPRAAKTWLPGFKYSVEAGIGAAALLTAADLKQDAGELSDIYAGRKDVAVRKGRWWMLGLEPFGGGEIQEYRPHLIHLWKTDAQYAQYGGKAEYFAHRSLLPNLHNIGGLRILGDPYYFERAQYNERPYPVSGGMFTDVPLIGPGLDLTIGQLLKPRRLMHLEELQNWANESAFEGEPGLRDIALQLGKPELIPRKPAIALPGSTDLLGKQISNVLNWTGMPGFTLGAIKENITGSSEFFAGQPKLASMDEAMSIQNNYYDAQLGGLLGYCLVGDTEIHTSDGWKEIKNVEPGDKVLSLDGEYRNVIAKFTKKSKRIHKLTVRTLSEPIMATPEHILPVYKFYPCHNKNSLSCVPGSRKYCSRCTKDKNINISDTPISEIRPGDFVCTPIIKESNTSLVVDLSKYCDYTFTEKYIYNRASLPFTIAYEILESNKSTTRKELRDQGIPDKIAKEAIRAFKITGQSQRFERYINIDEDLAYLFGWWTAEGSKEDSGRIALGMNAKELGYANTLADIILKKFGVMSEIKITNNSLVLRCQCIPLSICLEGLFGRGAHNKHIPYIIKSADISIRRAFFKGLVLGDGWVSKSNAGFTSASKILCKDLFDLGLTLGIRGFLNLDYLEVGSGYYPQGDKRKSTKRSYISWKQDSEKVRSCIEDQGWTPVNNDQVGGRSFIYDNKLFVKVISNEAMELETNVYDLAVEDLHYYVAGHIAVHNSEFFRRLWTKTPADRMYINPLHNTAPGWLPGQRSSFGDNSYIDFQTGDPYQDISFGEVRLPGPGYESAHKLHSGKKGVYDAYDRWKILADIAPFSKAHRFYDQEVQSMADSGQLNPDEIKLYQETKRRIPSHHLGAIFANYDPVTYKWKESGPLSWSWMPYLGTKLSDKRDEVEEYQRRVTYGMSFQNWADPINSMALPYFHSLGARGVVGGAAGGAALGATVFMRDPKTALLAAAVGAGAGAGAGLMGPSTPGRERTRQGIEEYFDALKYLKIRKLQEEADSQGRKDISWSLARRARRTMAGLDYSSNNPTFYQEAYSALPKIEREFFEAFSAAPSSEHQRILEAVPDYMKSMLQRMWSGSGKDRTIWDKDARSISFLEEAGGIPQDSWTGWSPFVNTDDVKVKTVDAIGENPHYYGSFKTQPALIETERPYVEPIPSNFFEVNRVTRMAGKYMMRNTSGIPIQGPSVYNFTMTRDRSDDIHAAQARRSWRF